jgi:hypothetical protein
VKEVCDQVRELLGDTCSRCDLNQAGPECGGLGCAPLPLQVANDLFTEVSVPSVTEKDDGEGGDLTCLNGAHTVVTLDNSISPVHSLLQVTRKNRKGLLYDCLRTLKDMKLQVGFHLLAFQYLSVLVYSLMVESVSSYLFLQSRLCKVMVQSYLSKIVAATILPAVYFGLCGTPHLNNVPAAADCKIVWLCESSRLI